MAASGNFPLTPLGGYPPYETLPEDATPIKDIPATTLTETPSDFTTMDQTLPSSTYSSCNYGAGVVHDELSDPGFDIFGENSKKEKLILKENRVKLIEYIHDCKVLFPYMKQKNVFTTHECEIIQHEVTGKQRMDKFIDIVLTKGPEAIGILHESLRKDYPFVFDVLTRLFSSANIDLPPTRQLREDPDAGDLPSELEASETTIGGISVSSYSFPRHNTTKHIRATIRRQMDELHERCEQVKSQRDDLQQALLQRERDINALLNHRDQQIQQKYEDMLKLLAKWRETMTNQSDGSIQKMQELLSEQEGIKEAYEQLEGEYMLVVSELSAARDRISKLLAHLEKMETEFALAQEEREALFDKISVQQGVIERLERRLIRLKIDPKDDSSSRDAEKQTMTPEQCSKTHNQLVHALDEKQELARMLEVAQTERKQAIVDNQSLQFQLYEEKGRRKKLEEQLRKLQQGLEGGAAGGGRPLRSVVSYPGPFTYEDTSKVTPLFDETIVMPAHDMGMELGMAVSVQELMEGGNAVKAGVKLGDEICQVNHIKVSSDAESLAFAQRLLQQASNTITLSIKRQSPGNSSPYHTSSSSSPASHLLSSPAPSSSIFNPFPFISKKPVEAESGRHGKPRKSSTGLQLATGVPRKRPPNLIPTGKPNFSSITRVLETQRDNSDSTSEQDSREFNDDAFTASSDTEFLGSTQNLSQEEGIITSPTSSMGCRDYIRTPIKFLTDDSNYSLPSFIDSPSDGIRYDSDSTEPRSLEEMTPALKTPVRSRNAIRRIPKRKMKKSQDLPKRLSKSLDDLDIVEEMLNSNMNVSSSDVTSNSDDGLRQVILPFGQLGCGLSVVGGRGNGLYIRSERHNERSLKTGDQIMKICGKSAIKMTYGEAVELMTKYNNRGKESVLTVKTNREGYGKLHFFSRDNFYVRAKVSHKSRSRLELSFNVGDVFHVTDTKPKEQNAMWQVEKLNSRGQTISTGYIPVAIDSSAALLSAMGSQSLPRLMKLNPNFDKRMDYTLQAPKTAGSPTLSSTQSAFKIYQPVKELPVSDLRPVVLFGVYEAELRESLVSCGYKRSSCKFATPTREPKEKLAAGEEVKVIESFNSKTDGLVQSTVDHVMEVAHSGHHCVLTLSPSDMSSNSRISSLHPIILALDPHHKTMRVKAIGGRFPAGFPQEQIGPSSVQTIKERIRSVRPYVTGEVSVNSPANVDELLGQIVDLVAEQQKNTLWELDLP